MRPVLLSLCLLITAGCSTVSEYLNTQDTNEPPSELVSFTPTLEVSSAWSREVGKGIGDRYLRLIPAVHGDRIYAAARDGRVRAFGATTGVPVWETDLEAPVSGGPGVGEGLVVVGTSEGEVLALSEADGALLWRARVSSEVLATPVIARGVVVARTVDGRLFGLDHNGGKRLWIYGSTVPLLTLRGTSSPTISGDLVITGFDGGRLTAVSIRDGALAWERRVTIPRGRSELERMVDIDSQPVIVDDIVYVATFQGRIAALDLLSGKPLWQRDMSSHAGFVVADGVVFVTDSDSQVWALDRFNGNGVWRQQQLRGRHLSAPAVIGAHVAVADFEGYVHFLSLSDGAFAARVQVDGAGVTAPPIARGGFLYVYGNSGKLTALRPG